MKVVITNYDLNNSSLGDWGCWVMNVVGGLFIRLQIQNSDEPCIDIIDSF